MGLSPHQRKRITQLIVYVGVPALVMMALAKISPGLLRLISTIALPSFVIYCFVNDDKPWARRILNSPKKWWQ
jgi:predicted permease